jgi:hypothetical protein
MPNDPKECREHTKHWRLVSATKSPVLNQAEALLSALVLVDQVRLSRLETQHAIGRSRESLAETSAALVVIKDAPAASLRRKVQRQIYALKPKRHICLNEQVANVPIGVKVHAVGETSVVRRRRLP